MLYIRPGAFLEGKKKKLEKKNKGKTHREQK
jgi:hypothetical protein